MTDYNVNFTDSVNKGSITVEQNSANTEDTSLTLPGLGLSNYGQFVNENFLHLLENFANSSAPSNPVEGQLWYDTTDGSDQLKVYDGTNWVAAGNIKKALSEPEAAESNSGDLWVNTSTKQLYLYTGAAWLLVGPDYSEGAATGTRVITYEATDNNNYVALANFVNDKIVALYASQTFTPKVKITGFPTGYTIKPGVNVPTESAFGGVVAKYYGTSEKAEKLVIGSTVVDSSDFARKSTTNDFAEKIRIKRDSGLSIGENDLLQFSVSGSTAIIRQFSPDGNVDIKVNDNGINTTALRITPQGNVGINQLAPQAALDVKGSGTVIKTSGDAATDGKVEIGSNVNTIAVTDGALTVVGGVGIQRDLRIGGDVFITGSNPSADPSLTAANIVPDETGTRNLGTASLLYNNVYANTYNGGTFRGTLVGNVTGTADRANQLTTPTTFSFDPTGDVVSTNTVIFDGTGSVAQWNLELNDDFIEGKTEVVAESEDDEFLVNRNGVLYKTTHRKIIEQMYQNQNNNKVYNIVGPICPIGTILPFAGTVAPSGWVFCHGQSYSSVVTDFGVADLEEFRLVIQNNYGGSVTDPLLPDFRGRFPIGNLTGTYTGTNRVTTGPNNGVGTLGGSETQTILESNLPDHAHTLEGDAGTQFYATTTVTGGTDTGSQSSNLVGTNPGTQINRTGDLVNSTNDPLNTVPPFVTIEFIIYTGAHPL